MNKINVTIEMKRCILSLGFIWALVVGVLAQSKPVVSVLGDSYSTYQGFCPKGYAQWYRVPAKTASTDVTSVEQTWWWQVIKEGGYKMGVINSYSGATICNRGYSGNDYTDRSFITRCTNLGCPDIILVCGGTNDSWADVKIGSYKYDNWTTADLFTFRPGMAKMCSLLCQHYPNADIYFILNTELKDEINESVDEICRHYGIKLIRLHDIDKKSSHPSVKGMRSFADQVLEAMRKH